MLRIQSVNRALLRPVTLLQECNNGVFCSRVFSRGKRTKKALAPGAQRIINMLSVFSAHKKQPRRLKLSLEDLIRHNMVQKAWSIYMRDKKIARTNKLRVQYDKIKEACDELESLDGYLAFEATKRELGKRFSPELRIPTDTPSNEIWALDWKATDPYGKKR
jgi:large subunit ribosomal protein L40